MNSKSKKKRLDIILVERGLFPSRERAQASIMAGVVLVNDMVELKPGTNFYEDVQVSVSENILKYVSRGGLKLEKGIREWNIDLDGKICMDIGASTGGFTDLMLQSGATKVYAIDVGYGQLDWSLRTNDKVVNLERTNFRYLDTDLIEDEIDFVCIDVSFISLKHIFPLTSKLIKDDAQIVALIKPQFEAERNQVGKKGIIKDSKVHAEVVENVKGYAIESGLLVEDVIESPITGTKGNIEFLARIVKNADSIPIDGEVNIEDDNDE